MEYGATITKTSQTLEPNETGTYFPESPCQHDFKFSHYESPDFRHGTSSSSDALAVMVCRHCGYFRKQRSNGWGLM